MTHPAHAELRPKSDDFMNSSVISHHDGFHSQDLKAKRWRWLVLAPALLLAACQAETAPAPDAGRPVQVQRVAFDTGGTARDFVGVVRARYETDLGFRVGGKIVARAVNVGDNVHIGDVIARLDPQDLQLQVESAEAELAAATSNRAQAAADLERYTILKDRGYAAIAQFDLKKAANDEAEGRLARARRALDLARNQLDYAELRADAEGVITADARRARAGGRHRPAGGAARASWREGSRHRVAGDLARRGASGVRRRCVCGRTATAAFAAQLRELSPQADPATRTYAARFTILGADDTVAFGMTATVTLERAAAVPVAKLPLRRCSIAAPARRSTWSTRPACLRCSR